MAGTPVITGILGQLQGKAEPDIQSIPDVDIIIMPVKSEMPVKPAYSLTLIFRRSVIQDS